MSARDPWPSPGRISAPWEKPTAPTCCWPIPPGRPPAGPARDLAFIAPPYGRDLAPPAIRALGQRGWLADGAVMVVELAVPDPFETPDGFEILDDRRYGGTRLVFLKAR